MNAVSSPAGEYSYTYVEQSHLLASVTGPVHTVTNSYESGRDTMTAKVNATSSSTISRFGARYDALGRRVEITRSGSAFAQNFVSDYQYDLLGQLTKDERFAGETPGDPAAKLEEESFAFLYDGIGNRLTAQKGNDTTAYTPNALNQYTSNDGIEPVYDADGNLFSDGKNRFHWDAENRLTLAEPLVPTEGSKRLEFKYDYIGRRVSKQVWTHTGGSWADDSTTAFVYDGWNLIEEIATSSQTASINHYTWGLDLSLSLQGAGGVGGLLSVVCAPFTESGLIGDWPLPIGYVPPALSGVEGEAPSTFHYTFDLNGNVSEVLDSTGSIAAHYEYGPFGELIRETYPSSALSEVERSLLTFNFSTKYHDRETGLLYYGYRYYDPSHGRWLNRDPIEESGGLNLYGFVGNDGVNRWDLWGMHFDQNNYNTGSYRISYNDNNGPTKVDVLTVQSGELLGYVIQPIPSVKCEDKSIVIDISVKSEHLSKLGVRNLVMGNQSTVNSFVNLLKQHGTNLPPRYVEPAMDNYFDFSKMSRKSKDHEQEHLDDLLLWRKKVLEPLVRRFSMMCCCNDFPRLETMVNESLGKAFKLTIDFWDKGIGTQANPAPHLSLGNGIRNVTSPTNNEISIHRSKIENLNVEFFIYSQETNICGSI